MTSFERNSTGHGVPVSASFPCSAGQKKSLYGREDVKNPKNHFRPFCSANLLSAKPFQPESHKTIFRFFREILGWWWEGPMISSPNHNHNPTPNPNMAEHPVHSETKRGILFPFCANPSSAGKSCPARPKGENQG
jgi:hypothetical protein